MESSLAMANKNQMEAILNYDTNAGTSNCAQGYIKEGVGSTVNIGQYCSYIHVKVLLSGIESQYMSSYPSVNNIDFVSIENVELRSEKTSFAGNDASLLWLHVSFGYDSVWIEEVNSYPMKVV